MVFNWLLDNDIKILGKNKATIHKALRVVLKEVFGEKRSKFFESALGLLEWLFSYFRMTSRRSVEILRAFRSSFYALRFKTMKRIKAGSTWSLEWHGYIGLLIRHLGMTFLRVAGNPDLLPSWFYHDPLLPSKFPKFYLFSLLVRIF